MQKLIVGGAFAALMAAWLSPAQAATIYLNCLPKDPAHSLVANTWVIDTTAATADPIGGSFATHYKRIDISPTKIEGSTQTGAGNYWIFDLNRVSGLLTLTYMERLPRLGSAGYAIEELICHKSDKPAI